MLELNFRVMTKIKNDVMGIKFYLKFILHIINNCQCIIIETGKYQYNYKFTERNAINSETTNRYNIRYMRDKSTRYPLSYSKVARAYNYKIG